MRAWVITPSDTFFFRNHKSFNLGESDSAEGIFPPSPGTVYGALRSSYIHANSDFQSFYQGKNPKVKRWMGTPDNYGNFKIKACFYYDGENIWLPLSLDHQVVKIQKNKETGEMEEIAYPLQLREENSHLGSDDCGFRLYGTRLEKSTSNSNVYVSLNLWKNSILNGLPVSVARPGNWLHSESKVGIALDDKKGKAQEHMLYRMEKLRFKDNGFKNKPGLAILWDETETPDFSNVSFLRLGGENRPWYLKELGNIDLLSTNELSNIKNQIKKSGIARIIMLTPAIWEHGYRPSGYSKLSNTLKIKEVGEFPLLTACLGRPLVVGGWDMKKNQPKPRKYAVPAGSVLYIKVKPEQAEELVDNLYLGQLTDALNHEGYGLTIVAPYNL